MDLVNLTNELRTQRNFNASVYLKKKKRLLRNFFEDNSLDAVVVPISGGIDSAIVLGIMHELYMENTLKKVLPIFIPINLGTTGQDYAREQAKKVFDRFGYDFYEVDGTLATESIIENSMPSGNLDQTKWAYGQLASIVRTPIIYYHAAILQTHGYRSIVVGTTNRDEGSYIGFYGKASDGMNDLQPIADIHKSEVFLVAELLDIPYSVLYATPKGDVWDGKVDTQMIGAPYWFLEIYLLWKEYHASTDFLDYVNSQMWHDNVVAWVTNIENLHRINAHKYQVGMPGHFVDVMTRKIPGGWK